MDYQDIGDCVGSTPLVRMSRVADTGSNTLLLKLEGNNPAGSVKDRPAMNMIRRAEERGEITPGDTLIEATSGNTGIALAMAAAIRGYHMILVMPENMTSERRSSMRAYGAQLVLVSEDDGMEGARDLAARMHADGQGHILDQFANDDNWRAHYEGTAPEIWHATGGELTHFVASMGTTGTIMGSSRFFADHDTGVEVVGVQPGEGARIPGIRKWPDAYLPRIYQRERVGRILEVTQPEAEAMTRRLAAEEGIMAGISSGGCLSVALRLCDELENATIAAIVCDRGDRYLSSGVFPD